jgi:hypothetical protein
MSRSDTVGSHKTAIYIDSDGALCVKYHNTVVWKRARDGRVTLNSGGWKTNTTKLRMTQAFRQFAGPCFFQVFQDKHEWWVSQYMGNGIHAPKFPYNDGMVIQT